MSKRRLVNEVPGSVPRQVREVVADMLSRERRALDLVKDLTTPMFVLSLLEGYKEGGGG